MTVKPLTRITHVEDEPDIRAIAELALKDIAGYEVDLCSSGTDALARVSGFRPDLIILDVMMPGMDGIETYKRLRQMPELATTPIVFMTAKAMQHEVERYKAMGAAGVIAKPFDPLRLPDRIGEIWNQSQTVTPAVGVTGSTSIQDPMPPRDGMGPGPSSS